MAQVSPVVIKEHSGVSFRLKGQSFVNLTMQSDKYISFYDDKDEELVILDMDEPYVPIKIPIEGYRAIVNPIGGIIAVMGKDVKTLTILDMETNAIIKSQKLKEDLSSWKWISYSTLGVVTKKSVYHWNIEGRCYPIKMFDRHDSLAGIHNKNLNYVVDDTENWLLLAGTSKVSSLQLYNAERKCSQIISGYKAVFCQFEMEGNFEPTNLLCYVEDKKTENGKTETKLTIMEVGSFPNFNQPFQKKVATVSLTEDEEGEIDTVIGMQVSAKYGIIFLVTLYGYVQLYDIESAQCIYSHTICNDELDYGEFFFDTAACEDTEGVIAVNMKGQVISVSINESNLTPYLKNMKRNVELATRLLERRCNVPSSVKRFFNNVTNVTNGANGDENFHFHEAGRRPVATPEDQDGGLAARFTEECSLDDPQESSSKKQNKKKKKKKKKADGTAEEPPAAATAATKTIPASAGEDDPEEKKQCIICYEREYNTVLVPCGHMWLCFECATDINNGCKQCPACRGKVENIFRVYTPE